MKKIIFLLGCAVSLFSYAQNNTCAQIDDLITIPTTITIGPSANADFPTIFDALDCLQKKRVVSGGEITLLMEQGSHPAVDTTFLDHIDGHVIQIVGDVNNPSNVVLNFTGKGLVVPAGRAFKGIFGVTLLGSGSGDGVEINAYSSLKIEDSEIDGFLRAIRALNGDIQTNRVEIRNANFGVTVTAGGSGTISDTTFQQTGNRSIFANQGSLTVFNPVITAGITGIMALNKSVVSVIGGSISNTTSNAVDCSSGSRIQVSSVTLSGNANDFNITPNVLDAEGSYIDN